jgi:pyruvate dehydrogenase E1 component alpha subunit/2-oxoisovalerate dehydrogenase E1 component alpha subunit
MACASEQGLDEPSSLRRVLEQDGSPAGAAASAVPNHVAVGLYRWMTLVRLLDERMVALQRQGAIAFYGACLGQEAVPVAAALALQPRDWVFPALREGAIMLVRGYPLKRYLAQLFGNSGDALKGRQMANHMSGRSVHQVSWSSCVGTQLPHAVGAAWAARLRGDPVVAMGFAGDGATSTPDFHAALSFAGKYHVPCVIVCQNNQWALSTPVAHQTASDTLAAKARAYGIRELRVDGVDALALYAALCEVCEAARRGEGPALVECVNYRLGPHSTSDNPTLYRREMKAQERGRHDPIERLRGYLLRYGGLESVNAEEIELDATQAIEQAVHEVVRLGPPPLESLFEDVFEGPLWHLLEQREEVRRTARPSATLESGSR